MLYIVRRNNLPFAYICLLEKRLQQNNDTMLESLINLYSDKMYWPERSNKW